MKRSLTGKSVALLWMGAYVLAQCAVGADDSPRPGVTQSEIRIGQTNPYSGPASPLGTSGRAQVAYFKKINDQGGVNGRRITLISLDDGYSPPKTVEQTRKLVEKDDVLLIFGSVGTAPNMAIHKYLNARQVPQLFISSSSSRWDDPAHYPWTMTGLRPTFEREAKAYADYVLRVRPDAKIGVLYQNDEFGKDNLRGLKAGLGERAARMIVTEQSYELTDATIDSQIVALKASGADTLLNFSGPKFGAQAIRKMHDIGWRPLHIASFAMTSIKAALEPAGLDKCVGLISSSVSKDPSDPQWQDDRSVQAYLAWMRTYFVEGDPYDWSNVVAAMNAQLLVHVLEHAGEDLTRANVMRQAANLHDVSVGLLLPGIRVETSSTDYLPVKQMQLIRFDGKRWVRFGDLITTTR